MWERVVGQERAVEQLRRAAAQPTHAYLLVGRRGSGVETAARCFAAEIVGPGDERAASLVLRSMHPDVVEFEPERTIVSIDQVREVTKEVAAAPVESDRKVVILFVPAGPASAPAMNGLLKTLEEPPDGRVIVVVTSAPDDLPSTVRSRCQRIELAPPSEPPPEFSGVRSAFTQCAHEVDGTGATVVRLAEAMVASVEDAITEVRARHEAELAELDASLQAAGYAERVAQRLRKRAAELRRLRERSARRAAIVDGIEALEAAYRDCLAGRADAPAVEPVAAVRALDALARARASFEFNPNEGLLLEWLAFQMPGPGGRRRR